jgi:hypothetical protein
MAAEESHMTHTKRRGFAAWPWVGALLLATVATTSASAAGTIEIIPSLGATKSTDSNAGDAQGFGGVAIRAALLPFLKAEGGIAYRQESFADGDLKVRQWPVTVSLWAVPVPMLYAGGGVGWYRTTFDHAESVPLKDTTTRKMGVHLGGGVEVPIAPRLGLDLSGRYIFMQANSSDIQLPTTFNPDFWTLSLGLAISF